MNDEIGVAAGRIYRFLDKNRGDALTMSKIKAGTKIKGALFDQAIGWLAREDKINLERRGRSIFLALK